MLRNHVAIALLSSCIAVACQSGDQHIGKGQGALIFAEIDEGHPAAVALSRFGRPFCTGTLVSLSVILTVAHCVGMLVGDPDVTIFFGTDIEGEGVRIGVRETVAHPNWTGNLDGGNDIGMLLMNFPVEAELVIPLSHFDMRQEVGTIAERVGFGI
ncbi:MAG: S1 family peptidase [Myxococcales bacterium]|nr:S1 family peptidase [Myxococcales bacterium]